MTETLSDKEFTLANQERWYLRGVVPHFIVAAVSVLLYAITITYGFSPLDEYWLITKEKETLSSFANIPLVFTEAPTLGMYYRPMLTLTFMIDLVAGGGSLAAFHIDNILLHIACVLLLFYFLQQLRLSGQFSFFATLIFAVHPLHVHAVAWVPGRNDLILASFLLLSCIFLIGFLRENKWWKLALHFFFFALCLLTKESAILLPGIFGVLWNMHRGEKTWKRVVPLASAWCVAVAGFYILRASVVHFMPVMEAQATSERVTDLFGTFFVYTGKIILPVQQSVMPVLQNTNVGLFVTITIAVAAAFFLIGIRDRKTATLGLVWFCTLIAIPVWLGMANGTGECYEHRAYTPMIGLVILFSQLNVKVEEQAMRKFAIVLFCLFALKTVLRLPVYADEISYVNAGVKENPYSGQFHYLLGMQHLNRGEFPEALSSLNEAIAIDTGNAEYYTQRAFVYATLHDYRNTIKDANTALRRDKEQHDAYMYRCSAYFALGKHDSARMDLDTAKWLGLEIPEGFEQSVNQAIQPDLGKSR